MPGNAAFEFVINLGAAIAQIHKHVLGLGSLRIATGSSVSYKVWPSYGLPGMLHMPTTKPSLYVVAIDTFTPNSYGCRVG